MNIEQIEERLAAIKTELDQPEADLAALEEEVRSLKEQKAALIEEAEKREKLLADVTESGVTVKEFTEEKMEERTFGIDSAEYRIAFFKALQGKEMTEAEKRAYTSASGSAGAAIPTETARELVKRMLELAPMLGEIMLYRVAGNLTVAVQNTRDAAFLHTEGAAITASSDVLGYVTLGGYEFFKLVQISKAVQTMAIAEFETWLVEGLAEDLAYKIENQIIYGNGTNQCGGLASITWTAGTNMISTTASITYDNVCTLMGYPAKGTRRNAKFLCNSAFPYTQLAGIKDQYGRPIFVESLSEDVPARLLGKEVLISDEVADDELYYGDFRKIVGNLSSDVAVEVSYEADFAKGLIDYRGGAVFDCKVADPGAFGKFKKN